jgi:hypothetical protein
MPRQPVQAQRSSTENARVVGRFVFPSSRALRSAADGMLAAPSPMKFLRENWLWIVAPIALFALLVLALNFLDVGEPVYPLR